MTYVVLEQRPWLLDTVLLRALDVDAHLAEL